MGPTMISNLIVFVLAKKEPQKYYNNLTDQVEKENDNYPKVN
jgi:hypothetical protein